MKIDMSKLSDETVRRMLADMLAIGDTDAPLSQAVTRDAVAQIDREPAQPRVTRRRRRSGPVTLYGVQQPITDADRFTAGVMAIYRAMTGKNGKSRKPMSENDIIAAAGRTDASAKKAAQSAIWFLRNHDAAANRLNLDLPKDARKAVVVNVRPE